MTWQDTRSKVVYWLSTHKPRGTVIASMDCDGFTIICRGVKEFVSYEAAELGHPFCPAAVEIRYMLNEKFLRGVRYKWMNGGSETPATRHPSLEQLDRANSKHWFMHRRPATGRSVDRERKDILEKEEKR